MLLIGSQALKHYIPMTRVLHDWDILMLKEEYEDLMNRTQGYWKHIKSVGATHIHEFGNVILEIHTDDGWTPSDLLLMESMGRYELVDSPVGKIRIPSLQDLYDIKRATAAYIDEPKHKADADLIKSKFRLDEGTELYFLRSAETKERVEKQNKVKYDFFHKYHIPEYIKHDYLHEVIADGLGLLYPTYKRIINAEVTVSEELFNNLTHDEKISLMVEESLVLALERWFIPQMVERGINYKLIEFFFNDNEGLPTYQILKHCCITGLRGEAEFITSFARTNFFEIEKVWKDAKQKIKNKGGLSVDFYNKVFKVRDEYKLKGKEIATI
jgi:hypothetical protein